MLDHLRKRSDIQSGAENDCQILRVFCGKGRKTFIAK